MRPRPPDSTGRSSDRCRRANVSMQHALAALQRSQRAADGENKVITRPQLSPRKNPAVSFICASPLGRLSSPCFFFPTTLIYRFVLFFFPPSQSRGGKTQLGPSLLQREKQFISLSIGFVLHEGVSFLAANKKNTQTNKNPCCVAPPG